jgi:phosphoribosylanthranilate isomerase
VALRAKICGLTRPEDAATAVAGGADLLGVVFAGGPRVVDVRTAGAIRAAAGHVPVLGVFGEQPIEQILHIVRSAELDGAQLHGAYDRDNAARLRAEGLLVWRVGRIAATAEAAALLELTDAADAVLVEPRVPQALGGTGVALDLDLACRARDVLANATMVLAGGLTPESVAAAAALVRPDIVDVSSGVERLPGIKDPDKIARFLEAVVGHSAIN